MGFLARAWKQAVREASAPPHRPRRTTKVFPPPLSDHQLPDPNLCLYVIGFEDEAIRPIKIGATSNLKKRLATLQTGCPWRLEVKAAVVRPDAFQFETWLHNHFDAYRIRPDGEWFLPPDDVDPVDWVSEA